MEIMSRSEGRNKHKEAVYYSPQHKMGIKVLSRTQLDNILPSYKNLMKSIERHRSQVGACVGYQNNLDEQYNLMFDNVFSIMGRRGSGKTSVVYTLKKMLEDIKTTDVVLPIIMSELIPESCEIIGWILSLLEDTVQDVHSRLLEKKDNKGMFKDCRVKSEYSIQEKYDKIKELCFSKSYTASSEGSFSRAVANSERRTQNSFDFSHKLSEFWADLREGVRAANDMGPEEEPMVYIIFDDVDLAPEKVWELLSTIVKYLSFPNVVVLVTADEETLYEVVKNILYFKISNGKKMRKLTASPSWYQEMAKLYVDKILPPSTRYYIENFENCARKSSFVAQLEFSKDREEIGQVRLRKFLERQIADYLTFLGHENPEDNFLHYESHFLDVYFLFWGDTSRQLGNECLIVEQLISNLKELHEKYRCRINEAESFKEDFFQELYHIVYHFIFSTLNANSNAVLSSQEIKVLVDELVLFQPEEWGVYFNYRYLYDRFDQKYRKYGNKQEWNFAGAAEGVNEDAFSPLQDIKENIMLHLLLFFVENLMVEAEAKYAEYWGKKRDRVHGRHNIVAMLDLFTSQDNSLVRCDADSHRLQEFLYEYGKILEKPEVLNQFDLMDERRVRKYFDALPVESDAGRGAYHYYINNPNWFKTMVKAVYLQKTGIYGMNRVMLMGLNTDKIRKLHDRGIEYLNQEEIDCICTYLEDPYDMGAEMMLTNALFSRPGRKIVLDEDWKEKNTITEITACVEKCTSPKASIIVNTKTCYTLLHRLDSDKYQDIFQVAVNKGISSGINVVTSEIMNLMNSFACYQIENWDIFLESIREIEDLTDIWINRYMITDHDDDPIDIEYINSLLRTVLVKSVPEENENFWFDRQERLNECYTRLRGQCRIAILEERDRRHALELILLKKVRMYMKCIELSIYFHKQKDADLQDNLPAKTKIPYDSFFHDVIKVSGKRLRKPVLTDVPIFLRELTKGYIREGVRQYVDRLLGETI